LAKEMAEREKEQQCNDKQALKRRREAEREEGHVAKAAMREEAARLKELRVAPQAEIQARRQAA
jgi:hypothetical protein